MMSREIAEIIANAAKLIPASYLRLTTTYEPSGIVRERVFCYELYHQIRKILGDKHPITLNGEIDKRGHIDFDEADRKNPDFIFHIPGHHEGNTIVLEVKGILSNAIIKDFETLLTFTNKYFYRTGVFLLYNHTLEELMQALKNELEGFKGKFKTTRNIYIITLPKANKVERIIEFEELWKS